MKKMIGWECYLCHYQNSPNTITCEMCETLKICTKNESAQNEIERLFISTPDVQRIHRTDNNHIKTVDNNNNNNTDWKCPVCTFMNHVNLPYCEVCYYQIDIDIIEPYPQNTQCIESNLFVNAEEQKYDHNNNELDSKIDDEEATLLLIQQMQHEDETRQAMFDTDTLAAKHLDEKYQRDEYEIKQDYKFALKIQRELAKDTVAWFCSRCLIMNLDPTSNVCSNCNKSKPKPKVNIISTPTLKNKMSMAIIDIARKYSSNNSCIINIKHTLAFITKYVEMSASKRLGADRCKPQICYHWTRKTNFEVIKKQSLKVPDGQKLKHQTDVGYYGKGIYTSNDAQFAKAYGHGANKLFVCLCLNGNMYHAKYPQDKGIGLKHGYDSHCSGDNKDGDIGKQWVFFDPSQLLLIYLLALNEIQFILPILNEIRTYIHSKYKELRISLKHTKTKKSARKHQLV